MYKKDGVVYYDSGTPCPYQNFNSDYLEKLPDAPEQEQPKLNIPFIEPEYDQYGNRYAFGQLLLTDQERAFREAQRTIMIQQALHTLRELGYKDPLSEYEEFKDYMPSIRRREYDEDEKERDPEHTYHESTAIENNGIVLNIDFMDDESYDAIKGIADRRGIKFIDVIWAAIKYYINKDKSRHKKSGD